MISQQAKTRLLTSVTNLVNRLEAQTRFSRTEAEAVVRDYVLGIMSTDDDVVQSVLSTEKIATVKHSYQVAQRAIATWVGNAPEALDTLTEIAQALNNDSDVVYEILQRLGTIEQDSLDILTELNSFRSRFNTDYSGHRLLSPYIFELLQQPAGTFVGRATTTMLGIDDSARDGVLTTVVIDLPGSVKMLSYSFQYVAGTATRTCATNAPSNDDPSKVKYLGWFIPQENIKDLYTSLTTVFNEATLELGS